MNAFGHVCELRAGLGLPPDLTTHRVDELLPNKPKPARRAAINSTRDVQHAIVALRNLRHRDLMLDVLLQR
jgi:hypothetical protein